MSQNLRKTQRVFLFQRKLDGKMNGLTKHMTQVCYRVKMREKQRPPAVYFQCPHGKLRRKCPQCSSCGHGKVRSCSCATFFPPARQVFGKSNLPCWVGGKLQGSRTCVIWKRNKESTGFLGSSPWEIRTPISIGGVFFVSFAWFGGKLQGELVLENWVCLFVLLEQKDIET